MGKTGPVEKSFRLQSMHGPPAAKGDDDKPTPDPAVVLQEMKQFIAKMDLMMDTARVAADGATINLAKAFGADENLIQEIVERQARANARKAAKAYVQTTAGAAIKSGGWKAPQDASTRAKALMDGAPAPPQTLERCWPCFPDLPPAGRADWLGKGSPGEADRPGQPLKKFLRPGPHRAFPTRITRKLYLLPLGDVSGGPDPSVLCDLLHRWFSLEVCVMPALPESKIKALERDENGAGYGPQIECPSAHSLLFAIKPKDAFAVIGYTMEDICNTSKGFAFLFGQARLDLSVAIFSFARYSDDLPTSARFLRRCGMVLCHEIMHLFGIKHCVYACCLMNGSNSLEESESRPFAACPVDLRKLQLTLDQAKINGKDTQPLDLCERERRLCEWFRAHGLDEDAQFSNEIVRSLTDPSEPVTHASTLFAARCASCMPAGIPSSKAKPSIPSSNTSRPQRSRLLKASRPPTLPPISAK